MAENVKGALVLGAVVAARRLRERGRLAPEVMAARLSKEALELVDHKVEVARWYPVAPFCELIDLGWEIAGNRDPAYLEKAGAVSADQLFDSNRYQQLDFAQRAAKVQTRKQLIRQARLITTITGTFYDFLDVRVALDANALSIIYGNARAFGDPLVHTTVGFKNQINVRQGSKMRWTGRRNSPDEVCFTMPVPKRLGDKDGAASD
jgi:hypothetical protein